MAQATARPYVYWGLCDQCDTCACEGRTLIATASPAGTAPLRYRLIPCSRHTARSLGLSKTPKSLFRPCRFTGAVSSACACSNVTYACMLKCNGCVLMRVACHIHTKSRTQSATFTNTHAHTHTDRWGEGYRWIEMTVYMAPLMHLESV